MGFISPVRAKTIAHQYSEGATIILNSVDTYHNVLYSHIDFIYTNFKIVIYSSSSSCSNIDKAAESLVPFMFILLNHCLYLFYDFVITLHA